MSTGFKASAWRTRGIRGTNDQRHMGSQSSRAELLIDCEEDRTPRAVLVGMLPGDRADEGLASQVAGKNLGGSSPRPGG